MKELSTLKEQLRWISVSGRLPEEVTNGDMIKAMFPGCEVNEHKVKTNSQGDLVIGYDVFLYEYHPTKTDTGLGFGIKIFFDNMWWNAPYKVGREE